MRKISIQGKKPKAIFSDSRLITILNRGRATVTLNPDGVVTVSSPNVPDGAVRRDTRYKDAVYQMSEQMIKAYDAQTLAYTQLHRKLKKTIYSKKSFENKVDRIVKDTYTRRVFDLPEPTKDEVKRDLRVEAEATFYNAPNKAAEVKKYIDEKLPALLSDRIAKWQEARALFTEIENAKEQKANDAFQRKYDAERNEELSFVNGAPNKVEPAIDIALRGMDNPFGFDFEYSYSQADGTISGEIELHNGVELPLQKGEMLASGKISVKNKLMREVAQQTTDTIFGFVFYLAWVLFGTSPNIDHVQLKIWDGGKQNGLLWVDFTRDLFAKNISSTMNPKSEIVSYPYVFDLRIRNSAEELAPIAAAKFNRRVEEAKQL